MLESNMAADSKTTHPSGLCFVTCFQQQIPHLFSQHLKGFCYHIDLTLSFFFPVLFFSRISGLTNNSSNLETKSFRSSYMKGIIGLSDWYFSKKGSTISDTKLKNLSFTTKVKGSLMASWTFL